MTEKGNDWGGAANRAEGGDARVATPLSLSLSLLLSR